MDGGKRPLPMPGSLCWLIITALLPACCPLSSWQCLEGFSVFCCPYSWRLSARRMISAAIVIRPSIRLQSLRSPGVNHCLPTMPSPSSSLLDGIIFLGNPRPPPRLPRRSLRPAFLVLIPPWTDSATLRLSPRAHGVHHFQYGFRLWLSHGEPPPGLYIRPVDGVLAPVGLVGWLPFLRLLLALGTVGAGVTAIRWSGSSR